MVCLCTVLSGNNDNDHNNINNNNNNNSNKNNNNNNNNNDNKSVAPARLTSILNATALANHLNSPAKWPTSVDSRLTGSNISTLTAKHGEHTTRPSSSTAQPRLTKTTWLQLAANLHPCLHR